MRAHGKHHEEREREAAESVRGFFERITNLLVLLFSFRGFFFSEIRARDSLHCQSVNDSESRGKRGRAHLSVT